jgi:hypothetical protein
MKLDEARQHLVYDPEKVNDGINYSQWEEWAGEIITLQREDTRWVWKQLQRLIEAERDLTVARELAEKYRDKHLAQYEDSGMYNAALSKSKLPWEKI